MFGCLWLLLLLSTENISSPPPVVIDADVGVAVNFVVVVCERSYIFLHLLLKNKMIGFVSFQVGNSMSFHMHMCVYLYIYLILVVCHCNCLHMPRHECLNTLNTNQIQSNMCFYIYYTYTQDRYTYKCAFSVALRSHSHYIWTLNVYIATSIFIRMTMTAAEKKTRH